MHPLNHASEFFAMSRERYNIKLRRDSGQPWPWSNDPIFQEWRFTNVFREDDRTTSWFRENVRSKLAGLRLLEATVIFRWFNRVSTGDIVKDLLINGWDKVEAEKRLRYVTPVVTGAYMIKTFNDLNKLDGILLAIDGALPCLPKYLPHWGDSLEKAWSDLKQIHFLGGFMAHEIVQDLRYTHILENAKDVNTWGHLGPGASRGMGWVTVGNEDEFTMSVKDQKEMLALMQQLLEMSRDPRHWPAEWPKWELHQVEFGLCEFSKYNRAKQGIRQKRRYEVSREDLRSN
jgi:hypothetical protein